MENVALQIPDRHRSAWELLLGLPEKDFDALIEILRRWEPAASTAPAASAIQTGLTISLDESEELIELFVSLHRLQEQVGLEPSHLAGLLWDAANEEADLVPPNLFIDEFSRRVVAALSLEDTIGVAVKAADVTRDHANTFCKSRILTDVRPIFGSDPEAAPRAFRIVHNLRIDYHESTDEHGVRGFFVALTGADLRNLQETIRRAVSKEITLGKALDSSKIKVLE